MVGKSHETTLKVGDSLGVVIICLQCSYRFSKNKWKNTVSGLKYFQDTAARDRAKERLSEDILILTLYTHTLVHPQGGLYFDGLENLHNPSLAVSAKAVSR